MDKYTTGLYNYYNIKLYNYNSGVYNLVNSLIIIYCSVLFHHSVIHLFEWLLMFKNFNDWQYFRLTLVGKYFGNVKK